MFYSKPKDVTYTGMAIFIDNHPLFDIKEPNEELENKIFEYLYHLSYMLSVKKRFFTKGSDYDNFSLQLATQLYFRLKKGKIKSILNYIKAIIGFKKIGYQQTDFSQIIEEKPIEVVSKYSFAQKISDSIKDIERIDFETSLYTIDKSIKAFLKRIPYTYNGVMWNNIYLSCLLTLIDQITLSNYDRSRIDNGKFINYTECLKSDCLDKESRNTKAILYHLDDSMNNYIIVLVREIKQYIANELSYICRCSISYSDVNQFILEDINGGDYMEMFND